MRNNGRSFYFFMPVGLYTQSEPGGTHTDHTSTPAEGRGGCERDGCSPAVGQGDHYRPRRLRRCYRITRQSRCAATRVWVPTGRTSSLTLSHTVHPRPLPTRYHIDQSYSSASRVTHSLCSVQGRRRVRNMVMKQRRTMTGPSEVRTRPAARLTAPLPMQSHPGLSPIKPHGSGSQHGA